MEAFNQLTERASILKINGDDSQVAVAVIPVETLAAGSPIAPQMTAIANALPVVAEQVTANNLRLMPSARNDENAAMVARTVAKPFQAAQAATIAEASAIDAAKGRLLAHRAGDPALSPMIVNHFAAMARAEQIAFTQRASLEETSPLIAAGRDFFYGTDETIWQLVERRHMTQAHIRLTGLTADYQRKPTADNPIAYGPDVAAVNRAAAEALQRNEARRDIVAAAESSLCSIVSAVALATGLTSSAAYTLLTTGKAA